MKIEEKLSTSQQYNMQSINCKKNLMYSLNDKTLHEGKKHTHTIYSYIPNVSNIFFNVY